jgi:hypothetical protein
MENNIFYKTKSEKFNPDIDNKYKEKETERNNNNFLFNNTIYNPITGIIPNTINSSNDLKINIDTTNYNIKKLISDKENERLKQDSTFKPVETILNNNNNNIKINTFSELKKKSYLTNDVNTSKYDDILNNLKSLGILKN